MATIHVTWITSNSPAGQNPGAVIDDVIANEIDASVGGTPALSGEKPEKATHAIVTAVDGAVYAVPSVGGAITAGATTAIPILATGYHVFRVEKGAKVSYRTI